MGTKVSKRGEMIYQCLDLSAIGGKRGCGRWSTDKDKIWEPSSGHLPSNVQCKFCKRITHPSCIWGVDAIVDPDLEVK